MNKQGGMSAKHKKPYDVKKTTQKEQSPKSKPATGHDPKSKPSVGQVAKNKPTAGQGAKSKPFVGHGSKSKPTVEKAVKTKAVTEESVKNKSIGEHAHKNTTFRENDVKKGYIQEVDTEDEGLDRLEGRNPVQEALKAGRTFNKILIAKGEREGSIKYIEAVAKEKGIIVQEVDRAKLDAISITHAHQGVIAYVAVKDYVEVEDILESASKKNEPPFIVILDGITDAHNLGSILRTANAAGVHGIIIHKRRALGLTATVAKASAGAIEHVPVARVVNISQTIAYLKSKNVWVVGTDATGDQPFYRANLKGALALVIGSEGEGMSRLVRESCDFVVNIPMKGSISSLNAAVAGAVVMYEILKHREQ